MSVSPLKNGASTSNLSARVKVMLGPSGSQCCLFAWVLCLCRCAQGRQGQLEILQCLLHMPQLLPEFPAFGVLFAVPNANSDWGMCSKRCTTTP